MAPRAPFLALLLTLAACSSAPATPTTAPVATSTPAPTLSVAQLGAAYLKLAGTLNAATCNYNKAVNNASTSTATLKLVAGQEATTNRYVADHLRALPWPADLAADARELVKALAAVEAELRLAAGATTRTAVIAHLNNVVDLERPMSAAANLLRGDLGVASVGVPCK